jgi:hypothetical protein
MSFKWYVTWIIALFVILLVSKFKRLEGFDNTGALVQLSTSRAGVTTPGAIMRANAEEDAEINYGLKQMTGKGLFD